MPRKKSKSSSLGERIKKLRRDREWSRQELGNRTGIHWQTITRYEYGSTLPSADALQKLAEVFGVSTDFLIFGDTEGTSPLKVRNKELLKRFERLDTLDPDDLKGLIDVMDVYIKNKAVKDVVAAG